MPSLSDLLGPSRTLKVETPAGGVLHIDYQPASVTVGQQMAFQECQQSGDEVRLLGLLCEWLADIVTAWDLTDSDGGPWPLTVDGLQPLPVSVMAWVFEAIQKDATPAGDEGE